MRYLSLFFIYVRKLFSRPRAYCCECDKSLYKNDKIVIDKRLMTVGRKALRLVRDSAYFGFCEKCYAVVFKEYEEKIKEERIETDFITRGW